MTDLTHVIPLGANCRLTHNVRRHFDHSESYPFDWWILPLPALLTLLRDGLDPARLYDPASLMRVPGEDGLHAYVEHRDLGIKFVHEFPGLPSDVTAPVDWAAALAKPKARLAHVGARLRALDASENTLLFVRFCIAADTNAGLQELSERLARSFPRARTHLLSISPWTAVDGYPTLAIDDRAQEWFGDFPLWSAALASTGFRLRNPRLRPFIVHPLDIDAEGAVPEATPGRRPGWLAALTSRLGRRSTRAHAAEA